MTLIEILVVIGIVSIVAALTAAAVSSVRNSARSALCANNLRQIGLALNSYASAFGAFPQSNSGKGYSPHVVILPFLEQASVYHSINGSVSITSEQELNTTMRKIVLSTYVCPSDGVASSMTGITNYAGNRGVGYTKTGNKDNGIFTSSMRSQPVTYSSVTDGTSSTIAMAEWLIGPRIILSRDVRRTTFETPNERMEEHELDAFVEECKSLDISKSKLSPLVKGREWMHGDLGSSLYNHNIEIGGRTCTNDGLVQQGAWTAGSDHSGGANVVFVDGHVRFLTSTIAQAAWRSLGTRAGGETETQY